MPQPVPQIQPFDLDEKDPFKRVKTFWDVLIDVSSQSYGSEFFDICRPISAEYSSNRQQATVVFELDPLPQKVCNGMNNLHGGAAATLFDIVTSAAIAPLSAPGKFRWAGVSRSLSCGYTRGMPVGTRGRIVCETVSVGARLCLVSGKLYDEEGRVCVVCDHHKASVDPPGL